MQSFRRHPGVFGVLVLVIALVGGCTSSPETVAYRDRLEGGFLTPEDIVRFKVSEQERWAATAEARDFRPLTAQPLDLQLFSASTQGDLAGIKTLLTQGAKVNAVNGKRQSALYFAAQEGETEAVRLLIKAGADVDGRGAGMSPLAIAALRGHTPCVQLLLRNRADVNLIGANGHSPLMNAVKLNRLVVAKLLLDAGADKRGTDRYGDNLLVVAINENLPGMLRVLLEAGVKPDMTDANGLTALYWARYLKRPVLADLLTKAGADPQRLPDRVIVSRPYTFGEY